MTAFTWTVRAIGDCALVGGDPWLCDGRARAYVVATRSALWVWCLCSLGAVAARGAEAPAANLKSDNPVHLTLDHAVDTESVSYFHSGCHVGLSLAVVNSDGSHYYDYGETTRSGAKLADRRSIYEIASVTKVFTAALAAKALVDKRMTLDGDFRSYLPDTYSNLAWDGQPITLRWLVTHRSGMPRDIPDTDAIFAKNHFHTRPYELVAIARGYNRSRTLAALHGVHLQSPPGEKESYSNAGFPALSASARRVRAASERCLHGHRECARRYRYVAASKTPFGRADFMNEVDSRCARQARHMPWSAADTWRLRCGKRRLMSEAAPIDSLQQLLNARISTRCCFYADCSIVCL